MDRPQLGEERLTGHSKTNKQTKNKQKQNANHRRRTLLKELEKMGLSWDEAQDKTRPLAGFSGGFDCGLMSQTGQVGSVDN